jgi:hypothetical protein
MNKLLDYTGEILITIVVVFALGGIGYLITKDEDRNLLFKQQCLESGMQYISGDCVR